MIIAYILLLFVILYKPGNGRCRTHNFYLKNTTKLTTFQYGFSVYDFKNMAKKILTVEDDPNILDVIRLILISEGYEVQTSDGKDIYNVISNWQPDVILMDIGLGELDGRDICRNIRADSKTRHLNIILMSAQLAGKDIITEHQANAFMSKPFEIDSLMDHIERQIVN